MAPDDPKGAAAIARRIKHPWYRCQALAYAAECSRDAERARLLQESVQAAQAQDEPNRVVTVAGWPVRVLAETSPAQAADLIRQLVGIAETEPHHLRRANALQALAFSVANRPELLKLIVPALAAALLSGSGWRIGRIIRHTFELVRATHPELLRSLALHHKANRQQQRLLASIPA